MWYIHVWRSTQERLLAFGGFSVTLVLHTNYFSDYHGHAHNEFTDAACAWHFGGSYSTPGTYRGVFAMLRYLNSGAYETIGSLH